jgi:hypothetical protein
MAPGAGSPILTLPGRGGRAHSAPCPHRMPCAPSCAMSPISRNRGSSSRTSPRFWPTGRFSATRSRSFAKPRPAPRSTRSWASTPAASFSPPRWPIASKPGERVLVVDDLLATGGTAAAALELLNGLGAEIVGVSFLIELTFLHGREKLGQHPIHSVLRY